MCSVDYNAYTLDVNPKPEGEKTNLRTTGCHIHIGYTNPNVESSVYLVKCLDATLGLASVIMDDDDKRRQLYGKAGCLRLTSYGVEYRVLSGYFIKSKAIMSKMYDLLRFAIYVYNNNFSIPPESLIIDTINNNNKELAATLLYDYFASLNGTIKSIVAPYIKDKEEDTISFTDPEIYSIIDRIRGGWIPPMPNGEVILNEAI